MKLKYTNVPRYFLFARILKQNVIVNQITGKTFINRRIHWFKSLPVEEKAERN